MQNVKDSILKAYVYRRAIKVFDVERKISDEDFSFILETARQSPSSFGWEPWKFLVVQNRELREKLLEPCWGAKTQLPTSSHFVIMLARQAKEMRPGSDYLTFKSEDVDKLPQDIQDMKLKFYKGFQEKEFDLTDDRKLFDWASKQLYIPLGNMMSSAAQIGIDSCPIEGFDREKVEEVLKNEGVVDTEKFGAVVMVAFGYRKEESPFPRSRHPYENVVQWVD